MGPEKGLGQRAKRSQLLSGRQQTQPWSLVCHTVLQSPSTAPKPRRPAKNYFAHPDRSRRDLRGCDDPCWTGKRPRGGEDGGLAFGPCFRDIWSSFGRLKPPLLSHWSAKLSGEIRGQQAAAETRSSIFRGHVAWRPRSLHCSIAVSC